MRHCRIIQSSLLNGRLSKTMSRVGLFGQISEINDHLFLSGAGVLKPDKIKQKKITFIVNATVEEPSAYLSGVEYLKIRIDDSPNAHLDTYFDMVSDRIKANKDRGGRTLVHCVAGVSRSASLCMVYLIKYQRLTLRQAYYHVKSARPIIRPNVGFWKQMIDYERRVLGHNSVEMIPCGDGHEFLPDVYGSELHRNMLLTSYSLNGYRPSSSSAASKSVSSMRRSLPPTPQTSIGNSHYYQRSSPPSSNGFTYSNVGGTSTQNGRATILSGRRSTSPAASHLVRPYRNGSAFLSHRLGGTARRAKTAPESATPAGTLFSSIYKTSQDMFFPSF